jgi:predicted amidohydrolase YtcJ
MKTNRIYLIILICISCSVKSIAQAKANIILFNGKVITVDQQDNIYTAVAIQGNKILAVGSDSELLALASENGCTFIDLQGKTVTPGLIDSHYHMMYYGAQFWPGYLNIRYPVVTCKADLLNVISDYVKTLNAGDWVSGNQGFTLQADEKLDRWDLDSVAPNNPVYVRHCSGQYSVVNSKALEIAGITGATPNPPSSLILHDSLGNPTGVLSHYGAENLVGKFATGYGDRSDEQRLEDIEIGQANCLQAGYTSIQDVIIGNVNDIVLYKQFDDEGRLKVRLYTMYLVDTEEEADAVTKLALPASSNLFSFNGWKLAMDGGIGGRTTLMYDKSMTASEISYPYHTQDEMNSLVKKLHDTGYHVAVHVSGDEGIDMTLTAFEYAMQQNPRSDPRHRIEHGLFPSASAIQRMKDDNIILSTQPQWLTWYGDGFTEATNEATMNQFLKLKTILGMDVHIAFGCDVPASIYQEPKWAFAGSVFRRTGKGTYLTQSERLTMNEALRVHTLGSAYAGFAESTTGSLEPGKFADLVIWSHDLYTINWADLINLEAELTIVDGKIVYDAGKNQITSVQGDNYLSSKPQDFQLFQNYPDPFNPSTIIRYKLPKMSNVQIKIYDALGKEVRSLINETQTAGTHNLMWDAVNNYGQRVSSGVYFYSIVAGDFIQTKKMILMK